MADGLLLTSNFRNNIYSDSDLKVIVDAFEENSLDNWVPKTKMLMYHGTSDITVPYQNSVDTYNNFISNGASQSLIEFIPLNGKTKGKFKILVNQETKNNVFNDDINDHKILDSALNLQKEEKNKIVTLVSKDINLRLKAKSLNLKAEDYLTGKIKNLNSLEYEGQVIDKIKTEIIDNIYSNNKLDKKSLFPRKKLLENSYYVLKNSIKSALIYYDSNDDTVNRVCLLYTSPSPRD